jgi:cell division septum initiation protein DivIVA
LAALNCLEGGRPYLLEQFASELRELSQRIDARATRLRSLQNKVSRCKESPLVAVENRAEKTQLLAENEQLVGRALWLERQMITAKLQLRLDHDHRDFCRIKRALRRLAGGGHDSDDEDEEIGRNRQRIKNLKAAIGHEKARLMRLTVPATREVQAAELIQKYWRGFVVRRKARRTVSAAGFPELEGSLTGGGEGLPEQEQDGAGEEGEILV